MFHWYDSVVNINPAVFNFLVSVYERIKEASLSLASGAFHDFESSYLYEENHGHPHRVDGRFAMRAGDIHQLLADIVRLSEL